MPAKQYKLSTKEKSRMMSRINYFRTMPEQIRKNATNLDNGFRTILRDFVDHEIKSVLVHGRITFLNTTSAT
jgi:hypothetical protein